MSRPVFIARGFHTLSFGDRVAMNRAQYLNQPLEVSIETLALCNARCTFCPYPTLERKGTRMPTAMIELLMYQMSKFEYPFFFSPFKVNEPLLDDRLPKICETFEKCCPHGRLRLFTNGSALTAEQRDWILNLKRVEHLWISLNSTNADDYERIMGLRYAITARRLDQLHESNTRIPIVISKVAEDDGEKNLTFFLDVTRRWPKFQCRIIKRDGWLGYVPPNSTHIPNQPCGRWFELSILATGKVALCCMDGTGEYAIGDVNSQTLLEVYNAPSYRERRIGIVSRKAYEPCARCTY